MAKDRSDVPFGNLTENEQLEIYEFEEQIDGHPLKDISLNKLNAPWQLFLNCLSRRARSPEVCAWLLQRSDVLYNQELEYHARWYAEVLYAQFPTRASQGTFCGIQL